MLLRITVIGYDVFFSTSNTFFFRALRTYTSWLALDIVMNAIPYSQVPKSTLTIPPRKLLCGLCASCPGEAFIVSTWHYRRLWTDRWLLTRSPASGGSQSLGSFIWATQWHQGSGLESFCLSLILVVKCCDDVTLNTLMAGISRGWTSLFFVKSCTLLSHCWAVELPTGQGWSLVGRCLYLS